MVVTTATQSELDEAKEFAKQRREEKYLNGLLPVYSLEYLKNHEEYRKKNEKMKADRKFIETYFRIPPE